jgi:hypothetical protein
MHRRPVHDVPVIKSIRKSRRRSRGAKLFRPKIDRNGIGVCRRRPTSFSSWRSSSQPSLPSWPCCPPSNVKSKLYRAHRESVYADVSLHQHCKIDTDTRLIDDACARAILVDKKLGERAAPAGPRASLFNRGSMQGSSTLACPDRRRGQDWRSACAGRTRASLSRGSRSSCCCSRRSGVQRAGISRPWVVLRKSGRAALLSRFGTMLTSLPRNVSWCFCAVS